MTDLLKFRVIGRLAASRWYPPAVQLLTLAAFALLIAGGLAAPHVPAKTAGILRHTNLAALIVWSLWWPLVIIGAAFLGRVWCQVCPMELVTSLAGRIGLKRKVPRVLLSGWGIAAFYGLALLGFIRTFWAHRYPERMAYFFLFLFASALVAGLVFEKRAFCDHLCPVGRLLGLYACCAPLEWRVREAGTCDACRTKDCIAGRNAYRLTGRGCTSHLYPAALRDNRRCLLCLQCRKVCPRDNLRWSLRRPLADLTGGLELGSVDIFLLVLVSGLVVWELAEEWSPARRILEFVPMRIAAALGASGEAANLVQALSLFVLLPGLLFLVPGLAGKLLGKVPLGESARAFGLLFLPVAALGHSVKALFRITSRLPYYAPALEDPVGSLTAARIASGDLKLDMRLADALAPLTGGLAMMIFAGILISIWAVGLKSPALRSLGRAGRAAQLAVATLYGAALALVIGFARF